MRGVDKQNYLFDPPISRKKREPGEGEVETGRGKKAKKWHLTLGLKEAIFAGIGIVGLMMMSFTLGALAGRGDIYRAAYSWGLLSPEARQAAQIMPQAAPPLAPVAAETPAAQTAHPAAPPLAAASPAAMASLPGGPATTKAAAVPSAAKTTHPAPIAGSMAPLAPPAATASSKKKAKAAQAEREKKAQEDQVHHERQEVAKKLTFLNSFDPSKSGQKKDKTTAKPQPTQVKVAMFRDSKAAKAKMAELQKQGFKASLKQSKDDQGACYTVYRQNPAPAKESEHQAKKKEKAAGPGQKPKTADSKAAGH